MSLKLHIRTGNGPVKVVDLSNFPMPCVIGRDSELAQVVVADSQTSRAHCVINHEGSQYQVEDLGSRNGTWVNDQKLSKQILTHGNILRLGSTQIHVELNQNKSNDPLVGKRLGGFELQAVIGKGRYGTAYRGMQVALNRPVAIKVLADEYSHDPARVQEFLTEARRAGRLNHPNLVQVHDVCQVDDHYLLIMELMRFSMADLLRTQGPLEERLVLRMLSDIGKALAYAESQRLVHRDVKPDNILVNDEGVYKLADLGIAAPITEDGQAHQDRIFGSPHYVAPEQAKGGSIDGRADLYALGATAWHLLLGKTIFTGTSRQVVASHINSELPDLGVLAPHLNESLVELLYDLLEKDPEDRPRDATAVVARVEDIVKAETAEPQAARRARPRQPRRRARRRR